jgi:hypothetical protein
MSFDDARDLATPDSAVVPCGAANSIRKPLENALGSVDPQRSSYGSAHLYLDLSSRGLPDYCRAPLAAQSDASSHDVISWNCAFCGRLRLSSYGRPFPYDPIATECVTCGDLCARGNPSDARKALAHVIAEHLQ